MFTYSDLTITGLVGSSAPPSGPGSPFEYLHVTRSLIMRRDTNHDPGFADAPYHLHTSQTAGRSVTQKYVNSGTGGFGYRSI